MKLKEGAQPTPLLIGDAEATADSYAAETMIGGCEMYAHEITKEADIPKDWRGRIPYWSSSLDAPARDATCEAVLEVSGSR